MTETAPLAEVHLECGSRSWQSRCKASRRTQAEACGKTALSCFASNSVTDWVPLGKRPVHHQKA